MTRAAARSAASTIVARRCAASAAETGGCRSEGDFSALMWANSLGAIRQSGQRFFFQAEDGIRDHCVTGVQTCALPIYLFFQAEMLGGFRQLHLKKEIIHVSDDARH